MTEQPIDFENVRKLVHELPVELQMQLLLELEQSVGTDLEIRPTWTDEELQALTTIQPMSPKEIVEAGLLGGFEDDEKWADSAKWVRQQRRKDRP